MARISTFLMKLAIHLNEKKMEKIKMVTEQNTGKPQKKFSSEDQYRVARLYEEVRGRLEELAMITARAAEIKLTDDTVRKFAPNRSAQNTYDVDIEIVCSPTGSCICIFRDASGQWTWEYCG
jgi:hypothetical protein